MKKKYTHVTIDRKKWFRGDGGLKSSLRLPGGKQCCLGFACRALGLKAKQILNRGMPSDVDYSEIIPGLTTESPGGSFNSKSNTMFSEKAARINDLDDINDRSREKQLKALARQNGFIFKFVN